MIDMQAQPWSFGILSDCHALHTVSVWLQELAADIANFGSQKEQRTKAAHAKLKAAKAALEGAKKAVKDTAQKLARAVAEAEAAATERTSLEEPLQTAQQALVGQGLLHSWHTWPQWTQALSTGSMASVSRISASPAARHR